MLEIVAPAPYTPAIHQLPPLSAPPMIFGAPDFEGTGTYMTRNCKGCCPYLPHRGGFGNELTCNTCNGTGHKAGCQAR